MKSLAGLQAAARRLPLEWYAVDRPINEKGQYQFELSAEFPFAIKRIGFQPGQPKAPLTWHAYQEIFVPIAHRCRMQMGGTSLDLACGDVLVMDHLKLHAVVDFPASGMEAIVIRFLPEIVHSAGSVASDHLILLPFYCQREEQAHVLCAAEPDVMAVHGALAQMIECYAELNRSPYAQSGARVYFLQVLFHLARHFQAAERLTELFARQHAQAGRLREVFAHIGEHYVERISLPEMARKAALSKAQFYRMFKKTAGMTLVDYVAHVRLTNAARLLRETGSSIAEIANATGFADQSYFDRRFRQHFGRTPLQFRRGFSSAAS